MSIKFEITMTDRVMCNFMIYHTYTHFSGIFGVILGFLALAVAVHKVMGGDIGGSLVFFVFAFLFILYLPFSMWLKAKKQVKKTPMFQKPIFYELTEEGVRIAQGEQETLNRWEEFQKAASTGQSLLLYVTKMRAIVLPKDQMGEFYLPAVKMISAHMEPSKVKIRGI